MTNAHQQILHLLTETKIGKSVSNAKIIRLGCCAAYKQSHDSICLLVSLYAPKCEMFTGMLDLKVVIISAIAPSLVKKREKN